MYGSHTHGEIYFCAFMTRKLSMWSIWHINFAFAFFYTSFHQQQKMSIWYKIYIYTIRPSLPDLINWNVVNYPLGELCPSHHSWLNSSQINYHFEKKKKNKSFPHCQCDFKIISFILERTSPLATWWPWWLSYMAKNVLIGKAPSFAWYHSKIKYNLRV